MAERDPTSPMLVLEHVAHSYDGPAVIHDLSLSINSGELVCLLGPSGCGKSTILRVIAGLEALQRGRITIAGQVVADGGGVEVPPESRSVALIFQDFALFPHLTVMQNVVFGLHHLTPQQRAARGRQVLDEVGMLDYVGAYPHVLSGGQQQRVALARARAPRPRVLLMDEPFSNLDVTLGNQIRDVVLQVVQNTTSSMLLVTHDPEEAMYMSDRIAVMRDGRIEQEGTPHQLYCHPVSAYVARLFTDTNRIGGVVVGGHVETPLGRICASGHGEGQAVEILIRPEAIRLGATSTADGATAPTGTVVAARMLGASSVVHLSVADPAGAERVLHVHVRIPGHRLPRKGERVGVALDPSQTFVFPKP